MPLVHFIDGTHHIKISGVMRAYIVLVVTMVYLIDSIPVIDL